MNIFEILGITAGGITSATVIIVGVIKFTQFLVKVSRKIDLIDEIEKEQAENKLQRQLIEDINASLQKLIVQFDIEFKQIEQRFDKIDGQIELQQALLIDDARHVLETTMRQAINKGWASLEEKKSIGDLFATYANAGGNHGVADIFHNFYKKLPLKPPKIDEEI